MRPAGAACGGCRRCTGRAYRHRRARGGSTAQAELRAQVKRPPTHCHNCSPVCNSASVLQTPSLVASCGCRSPSKNPCAPCRLPAGIQTPYERSGLSAAQFSRWLDQHSTGDVARGVANALQAAKGEVAAAEAASEGSRAVLAVMKQLCGM